MALIESLTTDEIIALINNGTWPTAFPVVTSGLNTAGQALACDVSIAGSVTVQMKNTGTATMAAGTFIFEGSVDSTDGTNGSWVALQASRSDGNTIETNPTTGNPAAGTAPAYAWEIAVNGYKYFRVRCTVSTTASSVATWYIGRGAYAIDPVPAIPTHPVTVTGTVTVAGSVTASPTIPTAYALIGAATTNATSVKASGGQIYEVSVFNPTAAIIYLKLYDKASAPTVGTDVPKLSIPVPVNGVVALEFGIVGKRFTTGIAFATTTGPLATDSAAVAIGLQISMDYI